MAKQVKTDKKQIYTEIIGHFRWVFHNNLKTTATAVAKYIENKTIDNTEITLINRKIDL